MTGEPGVVLLAEDEPLASMALRAQAEALGHTVAAVARDGDEAALLARCLPIDLAIFDMKMPGRSGLEAALTAFPDAPTPVLLLTGLDAADLPDPLPEPPIFGLVTKPIGLDELRKGIALARERFGRWAEQDRRSDTVLRAREERRLIARALDRHGEEPLAAAARTFLRRARDEAIAPAELARRILHSTG